MVENVLKGASGCLMLAVKKIGDSDGDGARKHVNMTVTLLSTAGQSNLVAQCTAVQQLLSKKKNFEALQMITKVQKSLQVIIAEQQLEAVRNAPVVQSVRNYHCTDPKCSGFVPEGGRFCPTCRKEQVASVCPSCHSPLRATAHFCAQCGVKVD